MEASDFLEALVGKRDTFERLGGFDVEDVIAGKEAFKAPDRINLFGADTVHGQAFRLANNDKFTKVSPYQMTAAQAYNMALRNL